MKARYNVKTFNAHITKMGGDRRIINVPATVQNFKPGDKVKVTKVRE